MTDSINIDGVEIKESPLIVISESTTRPGWIKIEMRVGLVITYFLLPPTKQEAFVDSIKETMRRIKEKDGYQKS